VLSGIYTQYAVRRMFEMLKADPSRPVHRLAQVHSSQAAVQVVVATRSAEDVAALCGLLRGVSARVDAYASEPKG
jgi:hypothetical protein